MAEHLAAALRDRGDAARAALLLTAVAGALAGAVRRRLLARAAGAHRAAGQRRRALRAAWLARAPLAWLRALL